MKDLSIIQEYMVCSVDEKGKIPGYSTEKMVCFVAAGILELQSEGCIAMDGKKVCVTAGLPAHCQYLEPLYRFIAERAPVKLQKIVESYLISFTDKHINELVNAVGDSLIAMSLAQAGRPGLIGNRKRYIPAPQTVRSVVEGMRAELLEDAEVTDETAALVILLEKGKNLKPYFSQYEQKEIRKKLKTIMDQPNGKIVREMVAYVENIMVVASAAAASAASV